MEEAVVGSRPRLTRIYFHLSIRRHSSRQDVVSAAVVVAAVVVAVVVVVVDAERAC